MKPDIQKLLQEYNLRHSKLSAAEVALNKFRLQNHIQIGAYEGVEVAPDMYQVALLLAEGKITQAEAKSIALAA